MNALDPQHHTMPRHGFKRPRWTNLTHASFFLLVCCFLGLSTLAQAGEESVEEAQKLTASDGADGDQFGGA